MSQTMQIIAKRLKNYRLQCGFTQEELAEKANLHHTYIGQVERGEKNITISSLEKILIPLNVSFSQLFMGIEPSIPYEDIAKRCYDLISTLNKNQQLLVYEILFDIEQLAK